MAIVEEPKLLEGTKFGNNRGISILKLHRDGSIVVI